MNIQILGRVVSLALCAVVVTISLYVPAKAAPAAFDPDDYILDVIVNGDLKTLRFSFDDIPSLINVWENPSNTKTQFKNVTDSIMYRATLPGTDELRFRVFVLGVETWNDRPAASGSVIDIGDIMPGAALDATMSFSLNVAHISTVGSDSSGEIGETLHIRYNFGFYMFDDNGDYLGVKWGKATESSYEHALSQNITYNPGYSYVFSKDVRYISPFIDLSCTDDINLMDWRFQLIPHAYSLSVNVNMIYENSSTMDRIEDELEDIKNGIDDTKDKLDDIISGGDAADAVKPDNDKISNSTDKMDDAMDDMDDAMDKLPTAPTDLGSLVDDEVLDKALSNGAVFFNWDASGLNNMFPPLGLSCGLSVLFYTIFGKKG